MEQVDEIGKTSQSESGPEPRARLALSPGHQGLEDVLVTEAAPEQRGEVRVEVTRLAEAGLTRAAAGAGKAAEADEAGHVLPRLGHGHGLSHVTVITLCHACHVT